jgi:hypothetical protein
MVIASRREDRVASNPARRSCDAKTAHRLCHMDRCEGNDRPGAMCHVLATYRHGRLLDWACRARFGHGGRRNRSVCGLSEGSRPGAAGTFVADGLDMQIQYVIPIAAVLAAASSGCTAHVETATSAAVDDDAVEVESVPAEVTTYPRTEYHGRVVYLVNGRWYYPHGRQWYYYRTEPAPLVRHRAYIQAAPPARPAYAPRPGEARQVQ